MVYIYLIYEVRYMPGIPGIGLLQYIIKIHSIRLTSLCVLSIY